MGMCSSFCIFQFSLGYALGLIRKFINTNTFVWNDDIFSYLMRRGHLYPPWAHLERDLLTKKGSFWWDSALFSSTEKPTTQTKWFDHPTAFGVKGTERKGPWLRADDASRGQSQWPWAMTVPVHASGMAREEKGEGTGEKRTTKQPVWVQGSSCAFKWCFVGSSVHPSKILHPAKNYWLFVT